MRHVVVIDRIVDVGGEGEGVSGGWNAAAGVDWGQRHLNRHVVDR